MPIDENHESYMRDTILYYIVDNWYGDILEIFYGYEFVCQFTYIFQSLVATIRHIK